MCNATRVLRVKPAWHGALQQHHEPSAFRGGAPWLLPESTALKRGVPIPLGRVWLYCLPSFLGGEMVFG